MIGSLHNATFPPLDAVDTVVNEASALVQRYRLLRALTDVDGIRKDLRGAPIEPVLADEMRRQLVAGVDGPLTTRETMWPIRAGVRLETLYASPWLAGMSLPAETYTLPASAADFAELFEQRTGILPRSQAMNRNYGVMPLELGRIAMQVRGSQKLPSSAYLMLCSRHFDEAVRHAPLLGTIHSSLRFAGTPVEAFKLLAELEREALMVEDVGLLNLVEVKQIQKWLDDPKPKKLLSAIRRSPNLKRLLDYVMFSSDVFGTFENSEGAGYVPIHPGARPTAAARGDVDADLRLAIRDDWELTRVMLRSAFPDHPSDTRETAFRNQGPTTFYGLNSTLANVMQVDLGHLPHGDTDNTVEGRKERQAFLADTIIAHTDGELHSKNDEKARKQAKRGRDPTGANRQSEALHHYALMLPPLGALGAAPRADATLWSKRYRDGLLWRAMLDRQLGRIALDLSPDEVRRIEEAFDRLLELFLPTLQVRPGNVTDRKDAIRAACDMATAVSAISTNRHFPRAILDWMRLMASGARLRADKRHGRRNPFGGLGATKVRHGKGAPPVGNPTRRASDGRTLRRWLERQLGTADLESDRSSGKRSHLENGA